MKKKALMRIRNEGTTLTSAFFVRDLSHTHTQKIQHETIICVSVRIQTTMPHTNNNATSMTHQYATSICSLHLSHTKPMTEEMRPVVHFLRPTKRRQRDRVVKVMD